MGHTHRGRPLPVVHPLRTRCAMFGVLAGDLTATEPQIRQQQPDDQRLSPFRAPRTTSCELAAPATTPQDILMSFSARSGAGFRGCPQATPGGLAECRDEPDTPCHGVVRCEATRPGRDRRRAGTDACSRSAARQPGPEDRCDARWSHLSPAGVRSGNDPLRRTGRGQRAPLATRRNPVPGNPLRPPTPRGKALGCCSGGGTSSLSGRRVGTDRIRSD